MAAEAGELARAKVNLCLHVTGRRPDGYHELDSLVVFPEIGDRLHATPAPGIGLTVGGPFAGDVPADGGNLVLRAAEAVRAAVGGGGAALHLEKVLPVASGIGGGSADAAATIRLLERLWSRPVPAGSRGALALALGADVPVCLAGRPARMAGIGERLAPAPPLPAFWLVLANPGAAVPTGAVFAGLQGFGGPVGLPAAGFRDAADLADWLHGQRNDLAAPARRLCPAIDAVLAALAARPGVLLARMSGSGATCFGLCAGEAEARAAAAALRGGGPGWWSAAAPVG